MGTEFSLDSPIYIITLAHLIISNLHLELLSPFSSFFPVPLGGQGSFILGEEKRGEEKTTGNDWVLAVRAAGCGL